VFRPAQEYVPVAEETSIMIQILDVYFEASALNALQYRSRNRVSTFGYDLEGTLYPEPVI
jgi:hypothetical protein